MMTRLRVARIKSNYKARLRATGTELCNWQTVFAPARAQQESRAMPAYEKPPATPVDLYCARSEEEYGTYRTGGSGVLYGSSVCGRTDPVTREKKRRQDRAE